MTIDDLRPCIGIDDAGNRFVCVEISDRKINTGAFPLGDLVNDPKPLKRRLANMGAMIVGKEWSALIDRIKEIASSEPVFKVAEKPGWFQRRCFILGSEVIYPSGTASVERVEVDYSSLDSEVASKFRCRGSVRDWMKNIGRYAHGNSRHQFALGVVFAPPLFDIIGATAAGGFQFVGPPLRGKTGLMEAASSPLGCKIGGQHVFAESWYGTVGDIIRVGLGHADVTYLLDETHLAGNTEQTRARILKEVAFAVAESTEKGRLTNLKAARSARLIVLSTSNLSVPEIMRAGDMEFDEALLSRFLDIPFPAGSHDIYDTWHEFNSGAELTNALKANARKYYGSVFKAYMQHLVDHRAEDEKDLKAFIVERTRYFTEFVEKRAEKLGVQTMGRAVERAAVCYAGIRLARQYGLVDIDHNKLRDSLASCLLDGFRLVQTELRSKPESPEDRLRNFLRKAVTQGHDLDKGFAKFSVKQIDSVPAYLATRGEVRWVYLTAKRLEKLVPAASDRKKLLGGLLADGILEKPTGPWTVQRTLLAREPGRLQRVYSFRRDWVEPLKEGGK